MALFWDSAAAIFCRAGKDAAQQKSHRGVPRWLK
jgi:hypothetical protein